MLFDVATDDLEGFQAIVLRDLLDRPACTRERLFDQCYGTDPEGGPMAGVYAINQTIWQLQARLRPGWRIKRNHQAFHLDKVPT